MDDMVDGSVSGLLGAGLSLLNDDEGNGTKWERFYSRFTERQEGACLNVDEWGVTSHGDSEYGDPITFVLRIVIGGAVGLGFLHWHLSARNHWPTKRYIPDLQDKGPHRAKVQCLMFNCFPANPHFGFRISLLPLPTKPYEFIDTGMWQAFVFTWPYMPRFDEPLLTQCLRDTVSLLVLAMQLLFFIILGSAAASWADVSDQGIGVGAALAVLNVYIVSVICGVSKLIFMYSFGWSVNAGGCATLAMAIMSSSLLGVIILGMTTALTKLSCSEFAGNIIMPFLLKQPMALVGAPIVYAFRNSFGYGPGVKGMIQMWDEIDELSGRECADRLTEFGRAADLHIADDDGKPVGWLEDAVADVESGDGQVLDGMRRALKETVYVIESSLIHVEAGLTSKHKKTGEWKAGRSALVKKLNGANALDVVLRHPMRQWRVSDLDVLKSVLKEKALTKEEKEMTDSPKAAAQEKEAATEDLRILLKEVLWCEWMTVPSMKSAEGDSSSKEWDLSSASFEVSPLMSSSGDGRGSQGRSSHTTGLGAGRASLGSNRSVSREGNDLTRQLSSSMSESPRATPVSPTATPPPSPPSPASTTRGGDEGGGGGGGGGKKNQKNQKNKKNKKNKKGRQVVQETENPMADRRASGDDT